MAGPLHAHLKLSPKSALAALAALALSAAVPATTARAGEEVGQATARPGDIVSGEPSGFHLLPGRPTNTKAWKIHYNSTTVAGAPNVVSGTVVAPQDGRITLRPLITYAVGTVGNGRLMRAEQQLPQRTAVETNLI
ncbi:hypothetical protein OV450_2463 [Actinobacteria bacterium OV450]|nr:hypothetical protein OV450_2463 [Actinobacteria bacterium OV450]